MHKTTNKFINTNVCKKNKNSMERNSLSKPNLPTE